MLLKAINLLFFITILTSCGEVIGFKDFSDPDIGQAEKIDVFFAGENLYKFYDTVSAPESDYVYCRASINDDKYQAQMKVRGFTSRIKPKKNYTLRLETDDGNIDYALMTEAGTWMKNRIVMYAYRNYKYKGKALVAAPRTWASALFINDEYLGYYSRVDIYSKDQLESIYRKRDTSELFKIHLSSYNENPLYSRSEKKFPDDKDFSSLETLISNVNNLKGEEWKDWVYKNIDVDDFIRYMVVHDFFGVTDTGKQNFYIYNYGKMVILPWDNELGMQVTSNNFYGNNDLTRKILEIEEIRAAYKTELTNLKDSAFLDELKLKVNEFYDEAYYAVKSDPIFYYSFSDFENMKSYILNFLENRKYYIHL